MKLCFSLWNVFLPYMNKQWDFFSSVLDRKDFLMRSFNSAVTEPVEDSSLSQQVLWHFGRFFFFMFGTMQLPLVWRLFYILTGFLHQRTFLSSLSLSLFLYPTNNLFWLFLNIASCGRSHAGEVRLVSESLALLCYNLLEFLKFIGKNHSACLQYVKCQLIHISIYKAT